MKHGLATRPNESNILSYAEDIWEQIEKANICRNEMYSKAKIKNAFCGFAFNLINIDDTRIFGDFKKVKIIQQLHKNVAILKPVKGNGIVLLDIKDYSNSVEHLFKDPKKFQLLDTDHTVTQMKSLQSYLRTLLKRNEITKAEFDMMRPKNAKPARAHGLPKIHKEFLNIPKFRPIIDTTGTTHCLVGKYLANLLNPLTINEYSVKDSFDTASRIKGISQHLFENGYQYILFDVESLFTNVPIKWTVDLILKRICRDKLVSFNLKKCALKKLILDTCTKTVFSFMNKLYQQKDGVSMGSSLGPVLTNIIMSELEDVLAQLSFIPILLMIPYW